MLTGDLVRPRLRKRGTRIEVDMLSVTNRHWLKTADDLIALFQQHVGQTRAAWERALEAYEGERTDYIVIRGLAKVLTDDGRFEMIDVSVSPAELRRAVFALGPVFITPDLFHLQSQADVFAEVGQQYGVPPEVIQTALFADLSGEYLLAEAGRTWTPDALISRYNLELARGVLYWASELRIDFNDTFKDFWRYLKLFKLMFWAERTPEQRYHVVLDGPISPFVHATTRYGRQFAGFLPALFLGTEWQMEADVHYGQESLHYRLDQNTPLASHFHRSPDFDSRLEADFAAEFAAKFGEQRGQWLLKREEEILLLGDTVMLPDFTMVNRKDGRRAILEIMGFWHPDYLRRKLAKIRAANRRNFILLIYESVNLTDEQLKDIPAEVLFFKNKPVLKDVIALVEKIAIME